MEKRNELPEAAPPNIRKMWGMKRYLSEKKLYRYGKSRFTAVHIRDHVDCNRINEVISNYDRLTATAKLFYRLDG